EAEGRDHHVGDGLEFFEWIVERTALEQGFGDMSARAAEQNSVAVRAGTGDSGCTERTAASPLVLHDYGAKHRLHLLRPWAPHRVVPAARREWDDEPDRTVGVFGLGARGTWQQRAQRQRGYAKGE